MTILGLAGVSFCKMSRPGKNGLSFVPKKILTWVSREARGGLKAIAGKRQQPYYHFIHTGFCYFRFLSARKLFSLPGHARNHFSTSTLWALATLNFEEHIKQAGQLTELLLPFHENNPEENKGLSKHLRFC